MEGFRTSVALSWIVAVVGFPIGGFLAHAIAGPAAGVPSAWLWIPVTGVAWGVGWLITSGVGVALAPGWPVYGLSGAVVSQIITAVGLWRLVPSRDTLKSAE